MTPPSLYILLTLNNVENLMSNNTINIALIGYGFVGKTFHAPLIRSVPGLNLAFVASRDEEKVKQRPTGRHGDRLPGSCGPASGR